MKRIVFFALAALASMALNAQVKIDSPRNHGMDPERLAHVDGVIEDAIRDGEMPGAVLSVVRGSHIVYLKAYGNKSVVPDTVAMTTNTIFDLASLSKCVGTTLSVMKLIEGGRLRLTDPVKRFIP